MRQTDKEAIFLNSCIEQDMAGFPQVDHSVSSYWEDDDTSVPPMSVYGFETPIEMEACLQPYVKSERLRKILVAQAFQNLAAQQEQERNEAEVSEKSKEGRILETVPQGEPLPAYVYYF